MCVGKGGSTLEYILSDDKKYVRSSVRELCEFIYRTGDVYTGGTDVTGNAMVMGAKIHRELQQKNKKQNRNYRSEYHISCTEEYEEFVYEITGSIDGIIENGDGTVIDEFKTTHHELENLEWDTIKAYSAQLMCYGYMYAEKNALNFVTLRLAYYNYDDDDIKIIEKEFTFTELRKWFLQLIQMHIKWPKLVFDHKKKRDISLHMLEFPFDGFRKGQRELSAKVYRCIRDEKRLFAEAPTGIGKTVSTLFPSLKALGEGVGNKIFYLSAKNVGAITAENCLDMCRNKGAQISYTSMTSKEKICPKDRNCLPSECEYSKGHYDRVNDALYELVSTSDVITKEKLIEISQKYTVCPFELQLDASEFCDVVIGDYNYVFDPRAKLCRYFGSEGKGDYITLVDEAHNLVDRAREMYSARLSYLQLKSYMKHFKGLRKLRGRMNKCIDFFQKLSDGLKLDQKTQRKISLSEMDVQPFRSFCEAYRNFLSEDGFEEVKKNTLQLYFDVTFFTEIFDIESVFSESYVDYCELLGDDCCVRLYCANPSEHISLITKAQRSTIFFSATMTPSEYYIKMLGARNDEDEILALDSPFPKENQKVCIYKNVSARFKDRTNSLLKVCEIINCACGEKTGNYFAFFPSYGYMEQVYDEFSVLYPNVKTIIQTKEMTNEEREEYIKEFCDNPKQTLVAFALCSGMFSEGLDLVGERLSGAVIVGTGLPQLCFERDLLKEHFDLTIGEGHGYNYAYTYTGLNRVYQAGGRVIRTSTDKGFIVLADDRYSKISHRRTFPTSWKNISYADSIYQLKQCISDFWKYHGEKT